MNVLLQVGPLFAQAMMGYSIVNIAVGIVLILAIVALVVAYCRWANVTIPPLLVTVFGIVIGAVIVIAAIIFLARFAGWA